MTDDFLTRTAERALGQATVVTPVLASTYQPGAGFGFESELTLATPWLAPPSPETAAHLSRQARAPAPDRRKPLPSPGKFRVEEPEAIEARPAAAAPGPGPSPSLQVEPPVDDPEPTLSPLAREQPPARPRSVPPAPTQAVPSPVEKPPLPTAERREPSLGPVEELRPTGEAVPTPAEPPLSIEDPTLSTLDELRPEAFDRDAPAADPSTPLFAASQPRATVPQPPGRRRAGRAEPTAVPETELPPEPTLDAAPPVQPTAARTDANEAAIARADSPVRLSPWSLPPTASRRLDSESRRAEASRPVRVTIGRVEIRGDSPPPASPAPPPPPGPALPLDEYLRTRGGIE